MDRNISRSDLVAIFHIGSITVELYEGTSSPDDGNHIKRGKFRERDLSHVEKIYIRCGYIDMKK